MGSRATRTQAGTSIRPANEQTWQARQSSSATASRYRAEFPMTKARLFSIALIPLVVACVSTKVDVPRDHPANPSAPVAQLAMAPALATTAPAAPETAPAAHEHGQEQHGEHEQHGGHDQHGPTPAPGGSTPTAGAPMPPSKATKQADKPAAEVWTCPMHAEVVKSGPGQCPICGMNLVKRAPGKAK